MGLRQAFRQVVRGILVHEEADGAAVHAVDRLARLHEPVQGLQHEPVAAQRHDDIGVLGGDVAIAGGQPFERLLRLPDGAGDEGYAFEARVRGAHGVEYRHMISRQAGARARQGE